MKQNKDNYFIKIKPEFLFDEYKVFKSNYTPWVYLAIKQKYNYYLDHAPHKTFTIDKNGLAGYLVTSFQTINTAVNELQKAGLLEMKKRKYRLIDEHEYLRKFRKVDTVIEKKYPEFIKVFSNAYEDLLLDIKKEILPIGSNKRLIVKCLKVYYYLLAYDRHCLLLDKEPILESSQTQTSLETETGIEHRIIKFLLSVLNDRGYIKLENATIYTLNKKTYEPSKHSIPKLNNYFSEPIVADYSVGNKSTPIDSISISERTVPEQFIGYSKSKDGNSIYVIYYNKQLKCNSIRKWCKSDGIPQTSEEFDIFHDLMNNGKSSQYYKPENYWLYQSDAEGSKKAA